MPASSAALYSRRVSVAANHPCLAGHFPGDPIVPGVLILEYVAEAIQAWKPGCRIAAVAQAKFHQLLRPEQPLSIALFDGGAGSVKFKCMYGSELIASGQFSIETPA